MTASKPRMLVLLFTDIRREPRANRQLRRFAGDYDVTVVGYGSSPVEHVEHIALPDVVPQQVLVRKILYVLQRLLFTLRLYGPAYWCIALHRWTWSRLSQRHWDIVIAHDVNTVILANRLKPRHGVIVDLHEYAPRQYEHSSDWVKLVAPYYRWICRKHVARAAAVVTVSQGIQEEYRQFGFTPILVTNATPFADLQPTPTQDAIALVHSGIAAPARRLDIMIDAVKKTKRPVTLDLYLVTMEDAAHLEDLKSRADGDPRIRFHDPVEYSDLINTLNQYDIGLSLIAATTFNHTWSLPNKFFDYVQARLGIIIGPSPEMMSVVEQYGLGAVTDDFEAESLTRALDALERDVVERWKRNAHNGARALSGEVQVEKLASVVDDLLANRPLEVVA